MRVNVGAILRSLVLLQLVEPARAAICAITDPEQRTATLSLYSGDCPGELEHNGVALTCKKEGDYSRLGAQLFLFDKKVIGKLWGAGKPITISFKQGPRVVTFDEQNISIVRNDYLDDYSYEIFAFSFPTLLAQILGSGSDIVIDAPGVSIALPTKEGATEVRKFIEACGVAGP